MSTPSHVMTFTADEIVDRALDTGWGRLLALREIEKAWPGSDMQYHELGDGSLAVEISTPAASGGKSLRSAGPAPATSDSDAWPSPWVILLIYALPWLLGLVNGAIALVCIIALAQIADKKAAARNAAGSSATGAVA
jgi:hypothetical protein